MCGSTPTKFKIQYVGKYVVRSTGIEIPQILCQTRVSSADHRGVHEGLSHHGICIFLNLPGIRDVGRSDRRLLR